MSRKSASTKTSTKGKKRSRQKTKKETEKDDLGPLVLTMFMFLSVALALNLPPKGADLLDATDSVASPLAWILNLWSRQADLLGATDYVASPLPLEMNGGDPYIRALMRTISAAESNTKDPYRLLYGGERVKDLSVHPDECIRIVNGPNKDDCTTAAGRYQFLTTTWEFQARAYHPDRPAWYELWDRPSFEPVYQDKVVHDWLTDSDVWGIDIAQRLRDGDVDTVLERLSGTWTSLGYGIETNSMSALLPHIYEEMLTEELAMGAELHPIGGVISGFRAR